MPGTELTHEHRWILVRSTILARLTIWVLAGYALVQGIGIIAGGPARWTGPAYAVVRLVPYATISWGSLIIAAGLAAGLGSIGRLWWLKTAGLGLIAVWSVCFSFGVFAAWLRLPVVGSTAVPVYLKDALLAVILIFVDERKVRTR